MYHFSAQVDSTIPSETVMFHGAIFWFYRNYHATFDIDRRFRVPVVLFAGILEVLGLKINSNIGYLDWGSSWFSSSFAGITSDSHDLICPHSFQIHHSSARLKFIATGIV
jgi:hypothetical protein